MKFPGVSVSIILFQNTKYHCKRGTAVYVQWYYCVLCTVYSNVPDCKTALLLVSNIQYWISTVRCFSLLPSISILFYYTGTVLMSAEWIWGNSLYAEHSNIRTFDHEPSQTSQTLNNPPPFETLSNRSLVCNIMTREAIGNLECN